MKHLMDKVCEPQKYEADIYKLWEQSGFFNPDNLKLSPKSKTYSIVLPPPNITDKLHLGHAAMLAIEDLLIRFHRMQGYRTLWLPGTDHAAIATQNAVEKKLLQKTGETRHSLGREKFLKEIWQFLKETQSIILKQTRKMGASLDWSREAFTLDRDRQKAVTQMFVDMYHAGAIYQGERIVNWCPRCHSTLADDEVEHQEQKAKLYTFKYWTDFPIAISTTRPETKIGDTAVAVNPQDKRYKRFIGKKLTGDFCGVSLTIEIIADREVDMDFGTGALGVTPAHSMIDWKMAEKNRLKIKKVINEEGKIGENWGDFSGLEIDEAKKIIIKKLKDKNLLLKEEEIDNSLAVCYRCGTAIEPLPSKQWFVGVDKKLEKLGGQSLKERALAVVRKKEIGFIPQRFEKRYVDWMENLHDWCISRQIWFGHRIPVWYRINKNGTNRISKEIKEEIYVGTQPPKDIKNWQQDEDVLDTWFSSGMWTFSTLGWPNNFKKNKKTGDLAQFHPTQVLETGYDILTLWVSRMIMMTVFALNEIPFEKVYLHGLVLDKFGKKMSKSKGNGIDPIDTANIFGADAVRLALLIGSSPGNDVRISQEKIASFRNLVTKIWNIYRYACQANKHFELRDKILIKDVQSLADEWIISRLHQMIKSASQNLKEFKFSLTGEKLQGFTWNELADWYLEIHKVEKNDKVLGYILNVLLKLWHPFIPFVTEKIWQDLYVGKGILMIEKWPKVKEKLINQKAEKEFQELQDIIVKIRNLRTNYHITPGIIMKAYGGKIKNKKIIEKLARVKIENEKKIKGIVVATKNINLELDIKSQIDIEKEKEILKKEIVNLMQLIKKNELLSKNKNFLSNAPQEVIEQNKIKTQEYKEKKELKKELLKDLK